MRGESCGVLAVCIECLVLGSFDQADPSLLFVCPSEKTVVTKETVPTTVELKTEKVVIQNEEVTKEVPVTQIVTQFEKVEVQGATLTVVLCCMFFV